MDQLIYFEKQEEFYEWLEEHHNKTDDLWVGYFKKRTGHPSLTWSESVDVALCFGWIDGIRKSIDEDSYKIRFTPRKVKSVWSAVNVKKVEALISSGKLKAVGLSLYNSRLDMEGYSSEKRNVKLSKLYEDQIKLNEKAWLFFTGLAPSYKRDSIWWIMSAKKEETRIRRLTILIDSSKEGLKIPNLRK